MSLDVDVSQVEIFLKHLRDRFQDQPLQLAVINPKGGSPVCRTFDLSSEFDHAIQFVVDCNEENNVYWTVNCVSPGLNKKPTKKDIVGARGLYDDSDPDIKKHGSYKKAREAIKEEAKTVRIQGYAPHLLVDSGNGIQRFWWTEVTPPKKFNQFETLNKRWSEYHGSVGTYNVDRLMRVPGTINFPNPAKIKKGYPQEPSQARILHLSKEPAYQLGAMEKALPSTDPSAAASLGRPSPFSKDFKENTANLTETEMEHLKARLAVMKTVHPKLRRRWDGDTSDLNDKSRSGIDMSLGAMFKRLELSFRETGWLLTQCPHGAGKEKAEAGDARYFERIWTNSGGTPLAEVLRQVDALGQAITTDQWATLIDEARLDDIEVEPVLARLKELGVGGKTALAKVWKQESKKRKKARKKLAQEAERQQRAQGKVEVLYDTTDYRVVVDSIENAMMEKPGAIEMLRFGNAYVRIVDQTPEYAWTGEAAKPGKLVQFMPMDSEAMLYRIQESVLLLKEGREGLQLIPPPPQLLRLLLNNPMAQMPICRGLIQHPLVLPNGRVLFRNGFDKDSGFYVRTELEHFQPAEDPSQSQAQAAAVRLREGLFKEFEFAEVDDQPNVMVAASIGALLTGLQRRLMAIAPAFFIGSSVQGSGKTTLAAMIHLVLTGRNLVVAPYSGSTEERRKRIVTALISSPAMLCFDNIADGIGLADTILAQVLTSPTITDRLLGASREVTVPTSTLITLTGNNVSLDADLVRRILTIKLDSRVERPEMRRFKNADVRQFVLDQRSAIIEDALTIVLHYLLNQDQYDMSAYQPSGFAQWDQLVRFPLIAAGLPDIYASLTEANREESHHIQGMLGILHALHDLFPNGAEFSASEILQRIEDVDTLSPGQPLRDLHDAIREYNEKALRNALSLGHVLKAMQDRLFDNLRLTDRTLKGRKRYRIEETEPEA